MQRNTIRSRVGLGGAVAAALLATSLSGCVIVAGNSAPDIDARFRDGLDTVLGAEVHARRNEVTLVVQSGGCTRKDQFEPRVEEDDDAWEIGFRRRELDRCKALMPEGERLTWTFAELGVPDGATVRLLNPVGR